MNDNEMIDCFSPEIPRQFRRNDLSAELSTNTKNAMLRSLQHGVFGHLSQSESHDYLNK